MLKLKFNEEGVVVIDENDRGNWNATTIPYGATILNGYGDENIIYIMPMTMQDGSCDIMITHSMVDSPSQVAQASEKHGYDMSKYDALLNELLMEVYGEYD